MENKAVATAADGQAVLDTIRSRRPDRVLTDVMMQVIDGPSIRARRADADS